MVAGVFCALGLIMFVCVFFFFSSRRRHTRLVSDWSSDVCSSDLGRKRAKESARFFKTYNSQIQADIMFNMRSFANFQNLRNSEHAQVEIKDIAQQMLDLVENIEGDRKSVV